MAWISLLLSYVGFLALALAMPRHHEEILGRKAVSRSRPVWRLTGAVLIALSLLPALRFWPDPAIGISAWLGLLTVSAFALAMALTWSSQESRRNISGCWYCLLPAVFAAISALMM